jgi:hypothetical protein
MHSSHHCYLPINIIMIMTIIIMNVTKERKDSPFDWFDWIELALTWQVSEQDETYTERTRIAARSVNINQVSLSYIWACIEQAGEWSSNSLVTRSFITEEEGMGSAQLDIYRSVSHTQKFNLLWSILFLFSFFYAWHYCPNGVNWAIERWHFNVCRHVVSDLLPLNRNDGS